MKELYVNFIYRIMKETGYEWDFVTSKFDDALAQGISPADFFDSIVDGHIFG